MPIIKETVIPTEQDSRLARESGASIAQLAPKEGGISLRIHTEDDREMELSLPEPAVQILLGVLDKMGRGNGITVIPVEKELTTQQAADLLGVSRPFLITEILERGRLSFRRVGNRRRINYADLLRYQEEEEREIAQRGEAMRELMAETERLGLYT